MSPFVFDPVLRWPWLTALAVAIIGALGWSFFRGVRSKGRIAVLYTLRILALAGLILILLLPQKREEQVTVLHPQLAVLVDTSTSMSDPVDDQQPKRSDRVKEFLQSPLMAQARQNFDVRVFTFDQQLQEGGGDASKLNFQGDRSNLIGSLRQMEERFRGQPLAGVLVLSDGLDTIAGDKAMETAGLDVPVFTFELEKTFQPKPKSKRLSIVNVDYPQRAVIGWESEIRVSVNGSGLSGQTIPMELWRDGQIVKSTTVAFGEDEQTRDVTFTVTHERPGVVPYEIHINDEAADKEAKNYPFLIEVLEAGNRVLYLQNSLGFDFKFLRQALVGDRNIQLVTYVRWTDNHLVLLSARGNFVKQTPLTFTPAELAKYSVIVLGDLPTASLSDGDLQAIRDFVDHGGALVLLGGPNGLGSGALAKTPLGEVLPVKLGPGTEYREGKFAVEITETGLHHPVFGQLFSKIHELPPLLTADLAEPSGSMAEVLVRVNVDGTRYPMVVANRFGQGRVVAVMTDTIWRWRLAAKSWVGSRSPYDTFWSQLMDWLIPKEQNKTQENRLEVFTDRTNYLTGENPEVRAILTTSAKGKGPATLPLRVHTPDGKGFDYTMQAAMLKTSDGREVPGYRTAIDLYVPGMFKAEATASLAGTNLVSETRFVVTKPATELTGRPINRELLAHLAEVSHGKFSVLGEWDGWNKNLHVEEQHFSRVQLLDLWNHPLLLGFVLAMLASDWIARKLWNLP